ncbi:hypothetical protein BD414DRAFT_442304 [Trametes punicea]|nr:hypothetical protein BD414DRAFT_442304 [Trametes punicea]
MHFTVALIFTSLLSSLASATALPKREASTVWESPFTGTIVTPTADQAVPFGADVPFEYDVSAWCEPAFSPFTVYLTAGQNPPVFDNVTDSGALADGAFVLEFGKFVVSRFGLPLPGPPPPSTLTMPTLEELNLDPTSDFNFFITVLEEFDGCPGDVGVEYSLTSVGIDLVSV